MTESGAALDARGLRFRYGAREALKGLDLSVARGEIAALLGPNGGGKTTAFRVFSTMLLPSEGSVRVFGHDAATEPAAVRAAIGVVFQHPSLDRELTALENLMHHGHLYGMCGENLRRRSREALERMGMAERGGDKAKNLSGGQRRRVELAKVLLGSPRLLLLDEPSTGLDPAARRQLMDVLQELRRKGGLTVLLTTHHMEEAERCDRVTILHEGIKVAEGAPEALKSELRKDVLHVEAVDASALASAVRERFGLDASPEDGRLRIERERGHEFAAQLVEAFPGQVRSVSFGKPSLEDVFLHRTGRRFWQEDENGGSHG